VIRLSQKGWMAVARASQAVAERAITEREAAIELWWRTGGDPRRLVLAIRAGVELFEGRACSARYAAGLEREVRRMRVAERGSPPRGVARGPSTCERARGAQIVRS
jgi:hypothetical protein